MRMSTERQICSLLQMILTTNHSRLLKKIDLIKNDDIWVCRAKYLIKELSVTLRSFNCPDRRRIIRSLKKCSIKDLVIVMGGEYSVMSKREEWLISLPGFTFDLSESDLLLYAEEYLDQLFFHASRLHLPKYPNN